MSDQTIAPRLIFGVGSLHRRLLHSQRLRLLRQALDVGFRDFDVAPAYGNGLNEHDLGGALADHRSQCRVTTKFGIPVDPYGARHPHLFHVIRALSRLQTNYASEYQRRVFSPTEMQRSLESSLRLLRLEHVDDFMIHEPLGLLTPELIGELHDKADQLKAQGKIRRWGVAGSASSIAQFVRDERIDALQWPVEDAAMVTPLPSHRLIGYGLYRAYLAWPQHQDRPFVSYLRRCLDRGSMDLIVSTTTPARLAAFGELFHRG